MSILLNNSDLLSILGVMVCLLAGSSFFSASETAFFFLSSDELQEFKRRGRASELRVVELLADPDRLLTAVLFWNLLINLSFFACSLVVSERLLAEGAGTIAGFFSIFSLAVIIVFGEVIPKSSAVMFRQRLARMVSLPLALSLRVFDPLAPMFQTVTRSLRRMFWPKLRKERYLETDDLEQAIDNSAGDEHLIRHERLVLHNILDLSEIPIEEVMRPRGTYPAMRPPIHRADLAAAFERRHEEHAAVSSATVTELSDQSDGHALAAHVPADYLAVLAESGDDVESAVPLGRFAVLPEVHLEKAAEEVVHVPWCATVAHVLHRLETAQCKLASVVNEFGETVGIATYEDIVDTILAPEPSRARRVLQRDPVLKVAPDTWHVDGITSLRYLSRKLKIDFEPEDGQVTVAGVFHESLERIPEVGDECVWEGFRMRVLETIARGSFRIIVTRDQ
jgi:CBS domain containing-hemolysin-like protein